MSTPEKSTSTERFHFSTTGITCGGCANSVRTILGRLSGVVGVQVDIPAQTAEVEVERGTLTPGQLAEALKPAGYGLLLQGH
ncbi:MAG: heavy-metal-associated domain-containing protein [Flavobacteriales bacterium]